MEKNLDHAKFMIDVDQKQIKVRFAGTKQSSWVDIKKNFSKFQRILYCFLVYLLVFEFPLYSLLLSWKHQIIFFLNLKLAVK